MYYGIVNYLNRISMEDSSSQSDFQNQLQISEKREKTLFGFEDFNDINGDKTKSDKTSKRISNSELKKSFDSNLQPSENRSNIQMEFKPTTNLNYTGIQNYKSPKFVGEEEQEENQSEYGKTHNQFTLRASPNQVRQNNYQPAPKLVTQAIVISSISSNKQVKPSSKRKISNKVSYVQKNNENKEMQQYENLCQQINYYHNSTDSLTFQNHRLLQSLDDIKYKLNNLAHNEQILHIQDQIRIINLQIQQQRSIEKRLTEVCLELQHDYEEIVNSVAIMTFERPSVLDPQMKNIIEQINSLKSQFNSMVRDEGSLNLSVTLPPPNLQPNLQISDRTQYRSNHQKSSIFAYQKAFQQIYNQQKNCEDPKFVYNLKMACLKQQWNLYKNNIVQIHASYRYQQFVMVTIGNKISNDLRKFSIYQNDRRIIQDEVLAGRSCYVHKVNQSRIESSEPFIKLKIRYNDGSQGKQNVLFIPNMSFKYGDFVPFTKKQFDLSSQLQMPEMTSNFRPIDKSIIKSLSEISHYIPNLLLSKDLLQCRGIIKFKQQQNGSLIRIQQKDSLIRIWIKNYDIGVLKTLEFIFTM